MLWSSLSLHSSSRTLVMLSLLSNARATDSRKILKDFLTGNGFYPILENVDVDNFQIKEFRKTSQMVILKRERYEIM